jgi:multidrug transporter EmrE-like cation transporter
MILGCVFYVWQRLSKLDGREMFLFTMMTDAMRRLVRRVSSSTELCWVTLLLSISAETIATLLSKHAAVSGSTRNAGTSHNYKEDSTLSPLSGDDMFVNDDEPSTDETRSDGATSNTLVSLFMANVLVILCQCGMTLAMTRIDMGVAYSVWAALGTATVSIWGMFFYDESADITKVCSLVLIVAGVVGLNLRPSAT